MHRLANSRPSNQHTHGVAVAAMAGCPSNTMTRSAKYVAMMKSCSITNAVFFTWRIKLSCQYIKHCRSNQKFSNSPFNDFAGYDTLFRIEETRRSQCAVNHIRAGINLLGSSSRYTDTLGFPKTSARSMTL